MRRSRDWIGVGVVGVLCVALAACGASAEPEYSCRYEVKVSTAYDFDDQGSGDSFQPGDWRPSCVTVATEAECKDRTESSTDCFEGSCSSIRYQNVSFSEGACTDQVAGDETATPAAPEPVATDRSSSTSSSETPTTTTTQPPARYELVYDATGLLSVNLPLHWADRNTDPLSVGEAGEISAIFAAPDLGGFLDSWEGPGMAIYYGAANLFAGGTVEEWLAMATAADRAECAVESENVTMEQGSGVFVSCGDSPASLAYYGAAVNDGTARLFLLFQWLEPGDLQHFEEAFETVQFR